MRYQETRRAVLVNKEQGHEGFVRLLRLRSQQAAGILRALQRPLPSDEDIMAEVFRVEHDPMLDDKSFNTAQYD